MEPDPFYSYGKCEDTLDTAKYVQFPPVSQPGL
jgi:hypothetical protein